MKKSIGYIYYKTYYFPEDFTIINELKKKVNVIMISIEDQIDIKDIKETTKKCNLILNSATFRPITFESIQLSKTMEELGKKVINSTHSLLYDEDKWMFYLKCLENKLPTPKTYLIPKEKKINSNLIKEILKKNNLILKPVYSDNGIGVERVKNYKEFKEKIKKIKKILPESPIIAQEFIPNQNRSYRVTLFGNKVEQAIVKINKRWKQTGNEKKAHYRTIKLDKNTKDLCEKASKILCMDVCGLDLIKNNNKWYFIEANGCPGMDFIYDDCKRLSKKLSNFLISKI
ncbi:MAG TPA: ATP-grasp domain-containing protein [Candidatus Nanoarchaeia archaeon]|nr:ATP-grasp domain-containing protein [Candidatus Nanoarchaeia archaeon]